MLCLASSLASCSSSSSSAPNGAAGNQAATAGAFSPAGTNSAGNTGGAGNTSSSGGTADKVSAGAGGPSDGGTQDGEAGGAGGTLFVNQILQGQGGGPLKCLPRALSVGPPGSANDGRVSCVVAELKPEGCDCSQTARAPLSASVLSATRRQLQLTGSCGGNNGASCDSFCGCGIEQPPGVASDHGSELYACQNDLTVAASVNGFCMIDQERTDESGAPAPLGNPAIVAECPANQKRLLRFVGAGQPATGAMTFLACPGATVN